LLSLPMTRLSDMATIALNLLVESLELLIWRPRKALV
jgi:hypothetical protein